MFGGSSAATSCQYNHRTHSGLSATPLKRGSSRHWQIYRLAFLVFCLFLAPTLLPAQTIYAIAAGADGSGLFRSTDTGHTWQQLGPRNLKAHAMDAVDSSRGRILYVAADDGIYKSTDFGKSWRVVSGSEMTDVIDVKVNQRDPRWIYAAATTGFRQSSDSGATWEHPEGRLGMEPVEKLAILPQGGLAATTRDGDGLNLWLADDPTPLPIWTLANCYIARNTEYYFSPRNTGWNRVAALLYFGEALTPCDIRFWLPVQNEIPAAIADMNLYDAVYQGSNVVYVAGDHGVWRYHSNPTSEWSDITGNLPDSTVNALALVGSENTVLAGTSWHGIYRRQQETWVPSGLTRSRVERIVVKEY